MKLISFDVSDAYLNANLEEAVYCEVPKGFKNWENIRNTKCCRLKKGLPGLKQSGRAWNTEADKHLKDIGYQRSKADPCLYYKSCKVKNIWCYIFIIIHVDDALMIVEQVDEMFRIADKDLSLTMDKYGCTIDGLTQGPRHPYVNIPKTRLKGSYLGIQITDGQDKITISQEAYIKEVLVRFKITNMSPKSLPMRRRPPYWKDPNGKLGDQKVYRQIIGSLLYAAVWTRPDIACAVSILSKFVSCPSKEHMIGAQDLLRYLNGTSKWGLAYTKGNAQGPLGYTKGWCDSDWAGDKDTRRSRTGWVYIRAGGAISWKSTLQADSVRGDVGVSLSTAEAEYKALCSCIKEGVYLRQLEMEVGISDHQDPTILMVDNEASAKIANNPITSQRTKHVDIQYHFARERIAAKQFKTVKVDTNNNIADCFTKPLDGNKVRLFMERMGMTEGN
jgi:hypothetical protein